jgi:hypothetical protein
VALLRRAAGLYAHICERLLPAAAAHVPASPPRELLPAGAALLRAIALAQAQGAAAALAEARAAAPATLAALYVGAADLFQAAAAAARGMAAAAAPTSERARRFLALSAELHSAKALRALAAVRLGAGAAGEAAACLRAAAAGVRQCLVVAAAGRDAEWAPPLRGELQRLDALSAVYERERVVVHMQGVAAAAPELPRGAVVVAPAPWDPPPCRDPFFR